MLKRAAIALSIVFVTGCQESLVVEPDWRLVSETSDGGRFCVDRNSVNSGFMAGHKAWTRMITPASSEDPPRSAEEITAYAEYSCSDRTATTISWIRDIGGHRTSETPEPDQQVPEPLPPDSIGAILLQKICSGSVQELKPCDPSEGPWGKFQQDGKE